MIGRALAVILNNFACLLACGPCLLNGRWHHLRAGAFDILFLFTKSLALPGRIFSLAVLNELELISARAGDAVVVWFSLQG
jgi:hypothetical protein